MKNGNGHKPTKRELREQTDRTVALADRTVGVYSVEPTVAPKASGSVEPGAPAASERVPIIPSATYDPIRAEGNWAPFRPVPEPVPGIVPGYTPASPVIGTGQWGGVGTPITAGFLTDLGEYNAELYGRSSVQTYEKMRRGDAQVWGTLMAVKGPLQSATWDIVPGVKANEPGHQKAKEIADFVKDNLFGGLEFQTSSGGWHSQSWDQIMWNALLCLDFGVSIHEDVYTVDGNFLKLRSLVPLLPITFYRWHTEADGFTLLALEQYGYRGIEFINATVPAEKICRFTLNQEGANFWGLSLLRSSYPHWYIKNQLYRIDAIASERNGLGVPVITLAAGASAQDRATAYGFVTKLSAHELTGLVLPNGAEFKIEAVQGQPRELSKMIEHHNRMISTTALAMFMTIGSAPHGSRATAATQHDFFLAASQHLATYIGKRITASTVRRLVWMNFGQDAIVPEVVAKNVKMRDFEDVRQALQDLAQQGLLVSDAGLRDLIRDEYELPPETDQGVITTKGEVVAPDTSDEPPTAQGQPPQAGNQKQEPPMSPANGQPTQRSKQKKGVPSNGNGKGNSKGNGANDALQASEVTDPAEPTNYFVRHGQTDDDADPEDEIISSWSNTPLNEVGIRQAHKAGEALEDKGITEIYTSDLQRAKQTADILAEHTGAEVIEDRGLRGWRVPWAGQSTNDELDNGRTIKEELNWLQQHPNVKPQGGDSWHETEARIADAVTRVSQRAKTLGKPIATVTHSRVINSLPALSRGAIQTVSEARGAKPGRISKAVLDGDKWNLTLNTKKLSDAGYRSIGDDTIIPVGNNRSGQPTQRRVQKKTPDGAPSDSAQEQRPAKPSEAVGGYAPTKRGNPKPVKDVTAKQAAQGARIVSGPQAQEKQTMTFKPSAAQEGKVSPVPTKLQPEDKQDTALNPTPEDHPVVAPATFRKAGKSHKRMFQEHHGEKAAKDLRDHYAGIFQELQKEITGPLKAKVIASVAQQATRQLKAGVLPSELHFHVDAGLESLLDDIVDKMYKKASDQAKSELKSKL